MHRRRSRASFDVDIVTSCGYSINMNTMNGIDCALCLAWSNGLDATQSAKGALYAVIDAERQ